jgi:hypothetical protein
MPLSEDGKKDIISATRDLNLPLIVVRAEVLYAGKLAGGIPAAGIDGDHLSNAIIRAGGTIHYPVVLLYQGGSIDGRAIVGYKSSRTYRDMLEARLAQTKPNEGADQPSAIERLYEVEQGAPLKQELTTVRVHGNPGAYFRWVPGTRFLAYTVDRTVRLVDIETGAEAQGPGYVDFIPSPDGRLFVTPGRNRTGLEFYDAAQVLAVVGVESTPSPLRVFVDSAMRDQYPSVGLLSTGVDSTVNYRVLTSWFDRVIFRDYEMNWRGGRVRIEPHGLPVPACSSYQLSLPIISPDGRELAARDEQAGTTKILTLRAGGNCDAVLDLRVPTGKVAWQDGGRRIAFAIPNGVMQDGSGLSSRSDSNFDHYGGVFVFDRDDVRLTVVTSSEVANRLTFPEFVGRDAIAFLVRPSREGGGNAFRVVCCVR